MANNWSSMKGRMLPSGKKRAQLGNGKAFPDHPLPDLRDGDVTPDTLALGWTWDEEAGEWKLVRVTQEDRGIHLFCCGATGSGKSMFVRSLIQQDIQHLTR